MSLVQTTHERYGNSDDLDDLDDLEGLDDLEDQLGITSLQRLAGPLSITRSIVISFLCSLTGSPLSTFC